MSGRSSVGPDSSLQLAELDARLLRIVQQSLRGVSWVGCEVVIREAAERLACSEADAWHVVQRLGCDWLSPLPLLEMNGSIGSIDEAAAHPRFVECRLSPAAVVLLDEIRLEGLIALLRGNLAERAGLDLSLWPDHLESARRPCRFRPALQPERTIAYFVSRILGAGEIDIDSIQIWQYPVFERQIHVDELSDHFEIGRLLGGSTDTRHALCDLSLGRGLTQVMDSIASDLQDCKDVLLRLASSDF